MFTADAPVPGVVAPGLPVVDPEALDGSVDVGDLVVV